MFQNPIVRAAGWMLLAVFLFITLAIAVREASAHLTTIQILFYRSLVSLGVMFGVVWMVDKSAMKTQHLKLHFLRNAAHFAGQMGWMYGLMFIPLVAVIAIEFTAPVWTAIFASFLLAERLTGPRIASIVLGFIGVLVIIRPGSEMLDPAAVAVFIGTIFYALSHTLTKKLSGFDKALTVIFMMAFTQCIMALPFVFVNPVWPTATAWWWVLLVAVSGLVAHFCMVRAFALADATVVVPMDFLRLPVAGFAGWWLYSEGVDIWLVVGAIFIIAGNLVNVFSGHFKRVKS